MEKAGTLLPTEATTAVAAERPVAEILTPKPEEVREETPAEEQARVFAKLKEMSSEKESSDEEKSGEDESTKE
jgi:hypothetical protein